MPHSTRTHEPSPSIATTPFTPFGSNSCSLHGTVTCYMVLRREIGSSIIAKGAMSAAASHAGAGTGGDRSSEGTLRLAKTL